MLLHDWSRRLMASPGACVIALVLTFALGMSAATPAQAAWSTTGNAAADSSSRDELPHSLAIDGNGGVYIAFPYSETNNDSLAIQHLNTDGAKAWGSQGVRINPGGNGNSNALLSPDSSGGVWAAWSDSRAGATGLYIQRFNSAGVAQLTAGGVRVFTRSAASFGIATAASGKLLMSIVVLNNDSLYLQRFTTAGAKDFSGDGVSVGINVDEFFAGHHLFADGEGAVLTFPRSISGLAQMWASRVNSAGTKQWGVNGVQVATTAGVNMMRQRADWTGSELFCSWEHASVPTGFFDAYPVRAQKLNSAGALQWTAAGVVVHTPVTGSPFFETFVPLEHTLAADGLGGCYLAWFDPRNYNQPAPNTFLHGDDIYGQRLNSAGTAQWTANGAPIDSAAGGLDRLQICTDAANGIFLCFTDFTFGDGDEDIRLRRVNGAAAPVQVFTAKFLNSIASGEAASRERNQVLIPDGAGGIFAAWEDNRDEGSSLSDVYAARRAPNGNPFVPSITVLTPNGGEALTSMKPFNITWNSTLGGNVKIEVSNGSFVRTTIVASTPDDGVFAWAPSASGNALKIYVSDAADGSPVDSSNATFSVCPALVLEESYGNLVAANDLIEADLNEDGVLDIVTATGSGAYVQMGIGTAGVGEGAWGTPVLVATASSANDVIADDFNDDGILDLAITTTSNGVQINFGNGSGGVGNGTYGAGTTYATGSPARGLVSLDANEDGIRDLAVANAGTAVSILLGNGSGGVASGTFAAGVSYTTGTTPTRLVAADFNEDGITDLAASCNGTNQVSVLLGQGASGIGNGTYAAAVNYATGTSPLGMCAGDFNEDGIVDLAVAHNSSASGVGVFLGGGSGGVGNGTFGSMATYAVGATVRDVGVLDLDGDGIPDLVATNQTGDRVYALFGFPLGGFTPGGFEGGGDGPSQLVIADFQENDVPDVVTGASAGGNVNVLEGYCPTALGNTVTVTAPNGGQFLQAGTNVTLFWTKGPAVLTVDIDLSRDGGVNWEPIATDVPGTSFPWTVTPQATTTARIRVRDSQLQNRFDISNTNFSIFTTAVLNLTSPNGGEVLPAISYQSITWTGNSGGNMKLELTSNGGATRTSITTGTLNDGQFLWPVPNVSGSGFRVRASLLSDPNVADSSAATFTICSRFDSTGLVTGGPSVGVVSADFNDDGILDLASATTTSNVLVSLGAGAGGIGNGLFGAATLVPAGPDVEAVAVGDLNRDGRLDLVAATDNGAAVMLGNGVGDVGNGTFGAATTFSTLGNCKDVELADLNEDGILDIVAANGNSATIAVLIGLGTNGTGTGGFAAAVSYAAAAGASNLAINDFNHDGILDVAVTCSPVNQLQVRLGQGSGGIGNGALGAATTIATTNAPVEVLACDYNEAGTPGLVVLCNGVIQTFAGNGSGGFTLDATSSVGIIIGGDIAIADLDGDPFPDMVVADSTWRRLSAYINDSGGEFGFVSELAIVSGPSGLALEDYKEDGVLDVAVGRADRLSSFLGSACGLPLTGSVTSVLPAGGEVWQPGTNHTLTWTRTSNISSVNLELTRDNGRNWEPIALNMCANAFDWTVTPPFTDSARVRVSDHTLHTRNSQTSTVFRIASLVDAPEALPTAASFSRPWPNPVRDVVRFEMSLPRATDVTVEAFDISGRMVHTLARGNFAAGRHPLRWGGGAATIPAGVYFVRARWEGFDSVQRVVRLE